MELKHLTLTHIRAFDQAEFEFQPGMNLLVGINGAGKSTVLDVLRIMLSQTLPKITASRSRPLEFDKANDITVGQGALTAELSFTAAGIPFEHFIHIPREDYVVDRQQEGVVRGQTYDLPERNDLKPDGNAIPNHLKSSKEQPLVLYFSTHRSLPSMAAPSKAISAGGQAAAFAEALGHRELRIREFADWWLVQQALAHEKAQDDRQMSLFENGYYNEYLYRLDALDAALSRFLDNCTNLQAVRNPEPTLLIDKDGKTLDIRMLSDGERSMIALVLDLARRLAIANPQLESPLTKGKAVVLIDELDLHLHPRWQRTIANQLTETFPNCQFIASTHSPQIIGEVNPKGLNFLVRENGQVKVYSGTQGYGLDTNWILENLMGTPARSPEAQAQIDSVETALEDGELDKARAELEKLRSMLHGEDGEVVRLEASINNLEALANEVD